MVSLKLSKKKKKENYVPEVSIKSQPDYPWGTSLRLENDLIKKLGVEGMKAGDMVSITGIGKVTEIHVTDRDKEKKYESMEIQIQEIEIDHQESAAKKMRKEVADEVFD
jgi:hypothetical protein